MTWGRGAVGWVATAWLVSCAPPAGAAPGEGSVADDALAFTWRIEAATLVVDAESPGEGWLCIGLNTVESLAGARLAMAAVHADGRLVVEEHVADPPRHAARSGPAVARGVSGEAVQSGTRVTMQIPLDPGEPGLPRLEPGGRVWLIAAWSHHDDFQHHSARRTGRWARLPAR